MTAKRIRLPKEGVVEPKQGSNAEGSEDVEGHGGTNPAPPEDLSKRTPSQGGEAIPTDDEGDVRG